MSLQPQPSQSINRQTTPPFLLRLFYRHSSFPSPSEFTTVPPTRALTASSVTIYTYADTTLSELSGQLLRAAPGIVGSSAQSGLRIMYRLVFPDTRSVNTGDGRGRWLSKELGGVVLGQAGEEDVPDIVGGDADRTLADARFVIGDYVCACVVPAGREGPGGLGVGAERVGGGGRGRGRSGNENGGPAAHAGYGRGRGGYADRQGRDVPSGDWRRGERIPEQGGGAYDGPGRRW